MNHLTIGLAQKQFEYPNGSLVIADELILKRGEKLYGPAKDGLNPLSMEYREAREFAGAVFPDKDLMTYRNGRRALTRLVMGADRLDRLEYTRDDDDQEARGWWKIFCSHLFYGPRCANRIPDTVKIVAVKHGMPDEEDTLAFYKEAIGTTHKIVSIDKDGDYRLPLVFNTDDDETSFWKADELELVKSAKAPTPPRFILQYELDTDPFELFATEKEVRARITELAANPQLKRDSLRISEIKKVRTVKARSKN